MQYLPPYVTPVGSYTPWPLGAEEGRDAAQVPGAADANAWRAWTTPEAAAGVTGMLTQIISAIRGVPTYPPGAYPPGYAPAPTFPWGTVLVIGGLLVGGYFLLKALDKPKRAAPRANPRRRLPYRRPRMNRRRRGRARRFQRAA